MRQPDPISHRIALFNLRIVASAAGGSGIFRLRDQNPAANSADCSVLNGQQIFPTVVTGTIQPIDSLLFPYLGPFPTFSSIDLPVNVAAIPEPSSMALCGLALVGVGYRKLRRKTA